MSKQFKMKIILSILIFGLSIVCINAQDGEFILSVNPDTVGVNQMIKIKFVLKNMNGNIEAQDWDESLVTYSPSVSNRTSIINGEMTHSKEYAYAVQATKVGTFPIIVRLKLHGTGEIIERSSQIVVVKSAVQPKITPESQEDLQFKRRDRNELPEQSPKKKRKNISTLNMIKSRTIYFGFYKLLDPVSLQQESVRKWHRYIAIAIFMFNILGQSQAQESLQLMAKTNVREVALDQVFEVSFQIGTNDYSDF